MNTTTWVVQIILGILFLLHGLLYAVPGLSSRMDRMREARGLSRHIHYVRQLRDWKWSVDVGGKPVSTIKIWGRLCAWTLARAHAGSGDCIAIAAYLGQGDTFDRAMVAFAEAYADQNERDYAVFSKAVKAGRIEAITGL